MVNFAVLQGRLVADPELKDINGISVCNFRIAWSEKYKDRETKLFLECTAWRSTAEFIERYFSKGQELAVEGRLHMENWQAADGSNRSAIRLTVDKVHFCGPKQSDGTSASRDTEPLEFTKLNEEDESLLPF